MVKSDFQRPGDDCVANPKDCDDGISFSLWEKVLYNEDVLNVYKAHDKKYIFSTGGDYVADKAWPGMALYHEGIDLVAIVSTGDDVWYLKVRGQLLNETWSNIGVRWEPSVDDTTGGLEVNKPKIDFPFLTSLLNAAC